MANQGMIPPRDLKPVLDQLFEGDYGDPIHRLFYQRAKRLKYNVIDFKSEKTDYVGPAVAIKDIDKTGYVTVDTGMAVHMEWSPILKAFAVYPA